MAELKNRLSAYLKMVRAGEEILVCDRKLPIARLMPIHSDFTREELELAAEGKLRLPTERFDPDLLFGPDRGEPNPALDEKLRRIVSEMREEEDERILGH